MVEAVRAVEITLDDLRNPPALDLYTAMTRASRRPDMLSERVAARMPDPEETRIMAIPPGVPVVLVLRVTRDSNGDPLETSVFTGSADRMSHEYQIPYRKPESTT